MFARHQKQVPKSFAFEVASFLENGFYLEGDPENGIVSRKSAVSAIIDAFIGEVERGKQADRVAKVAPGEGLTLLRHILEARILCGFNQRDKAPKPWTGIALEREAHESDRRNIRLVGAK